MKLSGFSIVELVVVITVMGILLVVGVASFDAAEVQSRDRERQIDVEAIAMHLEIFYTSGFGTASIGQYPSVQASVGLIGKETYYLRDLDTSNIIAPRQNTYSLISATNSTQTTSGVLPQPTVNQYVYQPIATNKTLCDNSITEECRKFNIYYRKEADNKVYMITSKNR